MGLDTTHDCWHGPYSSFSRWRNEVARRAGFRIEKNAHGFENPVLNWEAFEGKNYYGEWDADPSDPLLLLIVHSDCEGKILHRHTLPLAERLEEIAEDMPEEVGSHRGDSSRTATLRFAAGLREAHEDGEDVEFG